MNYIINPMWFYWIGVIDVVRYILALIAVCSGVVLVFVIMAIVLEGEKSGKFTRLLLLVCSISVLGLIFIPSKDTLIEMQIARYATYENADWTVESVKSAVDYIVQAIQGVKP